MAYISFQPSDFFNTKLYTGTAAELAITGVGFPPDMTWSKSRSLVKNHYLFDSVRGATKNLAPNDTDEEATSAQRLKSWQSDGFTLGTSAGTNDSSATFASWNWYGGTTTGIATNGSTTITPTGYSFNATSGQSIIAYTGNSTAGAKVPHGLGIAPDYMLVKKLNAGQSWAVYHTAIGPTKYLRLNTDSAVLTGTDRWNDTATDSVNFTVGDAGDTNGALNYIAYCFASVKGYSKFGSYIGNGNVDGSFVYTGFRPAYVLIKNIVTSNWFIADDKRPGANAPYNYTLLADTNGAEVTSGGNNIDILSNGFKARSTGSYTNGSGTEMTYMAFAEFPFVSSNSKAGTAR